MSLNKRIQILLAFLVGVPFLLLLFESYRNGRASLLQQMRSDAVHTAQFQSALVNDLFSLPRQTAKDLARILAVDEKLSQETVKTLLRRTLQETKETEGFSVALFDGRGPGRPFIPYVCWKNGKVEEMFLEAEAYGYLKQPWATPAGLRRAEHRDEVTHGQVRKAEGGEDLPGGLLFQQGQGVHRNDRVEHLEGGRGSVQRGDEPLELGAEVCRLERDALALPDALPHQDHPGLQVRGCDGRAVEGDGGAGHLEGLLVELRGAR